MAQADPSTSPVATTLADYQTEQRSLLEDRRALIASGANSEQLQAWHQQNASRFDAQLQRAQAMSISSNLHTVASNPQTTIPAGASASLANFLRARTALNNAHAQIHNQQLASLPDNPTAEQVFAMESQTMSLFQEQHGSDLAHQVSRARHLADEAAQRVMAVPLPLQIPANTPLQLAAYLVARDQFRRDWIAERNQYVSTDAATRRNALQLWRQQNAARIEQLRQMAQALGSGQ